MPFKIDVRQTMNREARELQRLFRNPRRLAALTAQAINATASEGRKRAIAAAAADVELPVTVVQRRKSRYGSRSGRSEITVRAGANRQWAEVAVHTGGIVAFQLGGGRQTREGFKARGKLFPRAFRVPSGPYAGVVFRRIRPKREGSGKRQMPVPVVPLRRALVARFTQYLTGPDGQRIFRRHYLERLRRELGKAGVRV